MADNTTLNPGVGGDTIASDDVSGVKHQIVKVAFGADGAATRVTSSVGLPVAIANPSLAVTGTFFQATQPVSISGSVPVTGALTDTQLRATAVPVSGTVTANVSGTVPVTGTFWQATQPVSGTVAVTGTFWQATQPVSIAGTVTVSGPLTDTQLRASAVPVSGTFYQATQPVSIATMPSTPVTGTFWQATQPVSGPLTDTQLRATAVPVSGTFYQATQPVSIAATVAVSGPLTDTQLRASAVPVSSASLPLPTGASTETTLAAVNTKTPVLGQATMANSTPVVLASNQSSINIAEVNATTGPTAFSASDAVGGAPDGVGTPINAASTAGSIVSIAVTPGMEAWTMQIASYGTGTIYTEGSIDSTNGTDGNWVALKARRTGTAVGVESVVYAMVANGTYRGNCAGITYLRARLIGTGTPSIKFILSAGNGATFLNSGIPTGSSVIGAVTQSGTWNVGSITTLPALATGSNVIGALTANQSVNNAQIGAVAVAVGNGVTGTGSQRVTIASDNTAFPTKVSDGTNTAAVKAGVIAVAGDNPLVVTMHPSSAPMTTQTITGAVTTSGSVTNTPASATNTNATLNSAATTNATSVKASGGGVYAVTASNSGAAAAFIKLYNKATAPTVGTDTPVLTIPVPASGVANVQFGAIGQRFSTGIAFAITNLIADTDTTAVAANQVKVMVSYI
jgi:hypothetical protein